MARKPRSIASIYFAAVAALPIDILAAWLSMLAAPNAGYLVLTVYVFGPFIWWVMDSVMRIWTWIQRPDPSERKRRKTWDEWAGERPLANPHYDSLSPE